MIDPFDHDWFFHTFVHELVKTINNTVIGEAMKEDRDLTWRLELAKVVM